MINEIIMQQKDSQLNKLDSRQINQKDFQKKLQKQNKPQISSQGQKGITVFLKNQTVKDKNLISTLSQVVTQITQKSAPTFKIKPILLVNKIQESRPHYKNNIINKELAYDVLLQTQKTIKIKNCISPLRPNSQIYKRLSKNFFQNLKNGIDQCILFTGTQSGARVQSSIGNQNNPGIFMIVAIAILDEKYKQNHERFDAQFSFLEYKGQKMYDLINYTQVPLIPRVNDTKSNHHKVQNVHFSEHYVKVCTFLQFIKLFKIALFNNGERDIKTNKEKSVEEINSQKVFEYMSSFIMKIRIKKYDTESKLVFQQETMLIDLDQNCSLRNKSHKEEKNFNQGQKQRIKNQKRASELVSKTLLDFILIEINNSNPLNKPIHYHMVEKNILLEMIKKYLRVKQSILPKNINFQQQNGGHKLSLAKQQPKQYQVGGYLFVINSFTPNPYAYQKNIKLYENLQSSVGQEWQAVVKVKNTQRIPLNQRYVQNILNQIIYTLKNQKYTSFKDLFAAKQFFTDQSKKIIQDIKLYRNLLFDYSNQKKNLAYNKNLLTAYQLQLIGKCIKSDNFKQFYTSKSYLSLPRQIQIKTQKIKNLIKDQMHFLKVTQEKFHLLKKKQNQNRKSFKIPDFIKNKSFLQDKQKLKHPVAFQKSQTKMQNTKFKMINLQQNQETDILNNFQKFNELKKYVYDIFNEVSHRIIFDEQRTIAQQIIFEENLARDIRNLKQGFKIFIRQVQGIDEAKIKYFSDEHNLQIQNLNKLMRTVHLQKKLGVTNSRSSKLLTKEFSTSQKKLKINIGNFSHSKLTLPKIYQTEKPDNIKQKSISSKQNKQSNLIQIKGKFNFGSMLLNPKKLT